MRLATSLIFLLICSSASSQDLGGVEKFAKKVTQTIIDGNQKGFGKYVVTEGTMTKVIDLMIEKNPEFAEFAKEAKKEIPQQAKKLRTNAIKDYERVRKVGNVFELDWGNMEVGRIEWSIDKRFEGFITAEIRVTLKSDKWDEGLHFVLDDCAWFKNKWYVGEDIEMNLDEDASELIGLCKCLDTKDGESSPDPQCQGVLDRLDKVSKTYESLDEQKQFYYRTMEMCSQHRMDWEEEDYEKTEEVMEEEGEELAPLHPDELGTYQMLLEEAVPGICACAHELTWNDKDDQSAECKEAYETYVIFVTSMIDRVEAAYYEQAYESCTQ